MICPSCRAESPDGSRFCAQCGAPVPESCPACGSATRPGDRFCSNCGVSVATHPPVIAVSGVGPAVSGVGPADVQDAVHGGAALAGAVLAGEERRVVTVVFADIVGFTSLAERLDVEIVRDVTAACFGRLVEEVARCGGTVDKFIGDAIMALFGTPIAHEDDPRRAVDAGLAMQAALGEINGDLERLHGLRLELRIGVNTGEVLAGTRDVGGILDATVIGDTVNVAARLQRAAAPGTVLLGETTARLVQHAFDLEPLTPLSLRGRAEPVAAVRALGPLAEITVPDAATLRLVGRDGEVAVLAERIERLANGQGQVIIVTGDPGVGKSRLLAELRRLVGLNDRIRWTDAQAAAYGTGQTYKMYATWARGLFGDQLGDASSSPDESTARLGVRLEALGVREALPFLCDLLGLPLDEQTRAEFAGLPTEEVHRRAVGAITRLHRALASERPTVIALDDLQWADPTVVEFLEAAVDLTAEVPLMFCFSFRTDQDAPCWSLRERSSALGNTHYLELDVGPLPVEGARALVVELLRGERLLPTAEHRLLDRVEGNPLFAHELVQTLVERRALVSTGGGLDLEPDLSERVPDTLRATILARLDRLPEDARQVVRTAAVLGRSFSAALLARVSGDGPALERGVREAVRAGLLRPSESSGSLSYTFSQGLVQEVAEHTLLVRRRKELHRAAADAMNALYPTATAERAADLVRHAVGAELWADALRYARLAAEHAAAGYATREAIRFYRLGLEAAEQLASEAPNAEVVRLLAGESAMLTRLGRLEEATGSLHAALELASRPDFVGDGDGEPARIRARLALDLADAHIAGQAVADAERAVDLAFVDLRAGQPELARAWCIRSWTRMRRSDLAGSAEAARTALRVALASGGFEERAQAYGALTKPSLAGQIGPSIAVYAAEAVRLAREHRHRGYLYEALVNAELLRLICLQPYVPAAKENAQEALVLAQGLDSVPAVATALVVLGATLVAGGEWDEAEAILTSSEAASSTLPIVGMMRRLVLGLLWTMRGRVEEAGALLEAVAGEELQHGGVWANAILAMLRAAAGDADGVRAALARAEAVPEGRACLACDALLTGQGAEALATIGDAAALELARRADSSAGGFPVARPMALRARALVAHRQGDRSAAIDAAEAALTLSTEVGQPYHRARAVYIHGIVLVEAGERSRARDQLAAALVTFDRLGTVPDATSAREALARLEDVPASQAVSARNAGHAPGG